MILIDPQSFVQRYPNGMGVRLQPQWWAEISDGYLRSVTRSGRRPNTRLAYSYELMDFGNWLDRAGVVTIGELSRQHLEGWQDEIGERLAPRTQMVAATAVRGALRWAADHDLPLSSPMLWLRVTHRRVPPCVPRPIPVSDLTALRARLNSPHGDLVALRTRALFWVLFSSGARISEALSLTRLSVKDGTALVTQKGGSLHRLMISGKAQEAITDYLAARRDNCVSLFVLHDGPRPMTPLCKQDPQSEWNRLCKELGIARFTSHQIRHSCATELLRQGVNPIVIAKHLGHHGLATIQGYAEVGLDSRRVAMDTMDAA